jgi:protein-S-isoprenylcysteine O-methyltransferase Ste14
MFPFDKVIITCWICFWLYWLISAFGSKKNTTPRIKRFIGVRLGLFVLAIIIFRSFNRQSYSFENHYQTTNNEVVLVIGFLMFLFGLILAIWARIYLGRNWGTPMSQKQDPELVTSGPYHYIRHPIYTGILLATLGSFFASSIYWLPFFIISGIYFVYSAVVEERLMMKQFPKIYPSYRDKTKMFIPFIF